MSKEMEALHAAAAAAREGMGLEAETVNESTEETPATEAPEIDSPDQKPEEEAPVEEAPATGEVSEDEPAPEEESEEEEGNQTGTSVYQQLNEIRSQKRATDAANKKILEAIGANSPEDALTAIAKLKENQPVSEAFAAFAKDHGIEDPKVLRGMYDLFSAETKREMTDALKPIQEALGNVKSTVEARESENAWSESLTHMNNEWKGVLPGIEATYKPDSGKMQQAHDLMAELAHTEKYHDKELEYILYKEQEQFEKIFGAPKRRTMLPSRGAARSFAAKESGGLPRGDGTHEGIMKAKEALAAIKNGSAFSETENL